MKQNRLFKALFVLVLIVLGSIRMLAQEPYAVLSDNNTVLTFYYDDQKAARNGMDVGPFSSLINRSWESWKASITSVIFDPSFAGCSTITSIGQELHETEIVELLSVHELRHTGSLRPAVVSVITDNGLLFALLHGGSSLGGHHDDTCRSTRTIDGS